ncbi:fimbrial protein [Proteus vulgaris]|uniref:Fimbrial protein n=1 Tax=Proteus vulgaris TaxID=585 RepID=A0A6G6SKI5_PROVU|nr:fimbrial protein [Proteus vulgaris]QIF94190.1 fimbrial protein [Proteus vulgaris]WIF74163.1 fimbrial protein [Proteus vulgaris]CRL59667.1 Fimbrial protein [Proteus vulgaris]
MKKNLLSMLILSTTFLSTQSNALEYTEKNVGTITINGSVTANPTCQLQDIQPVQLPPVQANNFGDNHIAKTDAQPLSIQFTNCSESLSNIQLKIPKQTKNSLVNQADNGSNVNIAIFDSEKNIIQLSNERPKAFNLNIDKNAKTADFSFEVNYMKPNGLDATPGLVRSSLSFDVIYSDVAVD